MKDIFKMGDLVKHRSILADRNKGFGVIVDILPTEYTKIDSIKVLWYDGTNSWMNRAQLEVHARGQDGEYS